MIAFRANEKLFCLDKDSVLYPGILPSKGFPFGSVVKNLPTSVADTGSTSGLERSPGEGMATCSSILARETHGQVSLAGYSPWGCKGLDTTDRLSTLAGNI